MVDARANMIGPRVVVLVDESRRMQLPASGAAQTRIERAQEVVGALREHFASARLGVLGFSEGALTPISLDAGAVRLETRGTSSDLSAALRELGRTLGERPRAIVVVSDGRLSRPQPGIADAALREALGNLGVPIHTVSVADESPDDASIRGVRAAGVAVAHQPLAVTVEVGCAGDLRCDRIPVSIRELRDGVPPAELARGVAEIRDGTGTVELEITLGRAGGRVLELAIDAPQGDRIPAQAAPDLRRGSRAHPAAPPRGPPHL
jgi:hypothetical protein